MVTKLKLSNFKAHRNREIDLSGLTILTGVNSSGKTSLIQALLLLRQSFVKNKLRDGLELNDDLVKIGLCDEALHRIPSEPAIIISIFNNDTEMFFKFDAGEKYLNSTFIYRDKTTSYADIEALDAVSLFNSNFQYISADRIGGESIFEKSDYEVINQRQVSKYFGEGELAVQYLLQFQTEPCVDLFNDSESTLLDEVRKWEHKISSNISFNIEDDKQGNVVITYGYSLSNNTVKSIEGISADNMGFGVSYSLAIIIALLSAKPGALIILENPEAHLHPQAQSEIANLISLVAERGVQVIVETHSDHIINGVLVNCKKKERGERGIDREKVSIYYIGGKDEFHSAIIDKIEVLENGRINKQPDGFFDKAEQDLMYLAGWRD
jgi:predicted ATPase